jgi:hypothetical protein
MIGKNDVFNIEIPLGDQVTTTYLGATVGTYTPTVCLEKGYVWRVIDFRMVASTSYAAAAACYTFILADADANTIATVNNAVTAITANPATGIDASPVAAYKEINTVSAGSYLQLRPTQSGAGRGYAGLKAVIRVQRMHPGT